MQYIGISFFLGVHDLVMLFWWSVCWAFRRALVAPGVLVHVCKAKEGGPLCFFIFQWPIYAWVEIGENLLENPFLVADLRSSGTSLRLQPGKDIWWCIDKKAVGVNSCMFVPPGKNTQTQHLEDA